jgi:hypothetical protein
MRKKLLKGIVQYKITEIMPSHPGIVVETSGASNWMLCYGAKYWKGYFEFLHPLLAG